MAQSIVDIAVAVAREHGGRSIERISVDIGAMRAVYPELLVEAFAYTAEETLAKGAELDWTETPMEFLCGECEARYTAEELLEPCPQCGGHAGRLVSGDELMVRSVTLAD
ncbi:MAG: hydrogenase maturation nickel metallochaperone HypA [Candidatus Hydrogenedentota bacterium]